MTLAAVLAAVTLSQGVSARTWGTDTCTGRTEVQLVTSSALSESRRAQREASGSTVDPTTDAATADGDAATCNIRLAWDLPPSAEVVCMVIVHEAGHLHRVQFPDNAADPDHSPDPLSVMAARPKVVPPACMLAFSPVRVRWLASRGWHCESNGTTVSWTCRRGAARVIRRGWAWRRSNAAQRQPTRMPR